MKATLRQLGALWPSFVGAALLALPGHQFSILRHADRCNDWPPVLEGAAWAAVYVAAVALLTIGWQRGRRSSMSARQLLGWGVAVHLVAWCAPPFLSLDIFNYVATARAAAARWGNAFLPIDRVLPAGDPLLGLMAAQCRGLGTGYLHGFVAVAWLIGKAAGGRVMLNLQLFRLVALAAIVVAAWLTGAAAASRDNSDDGSDDGDGRGDDGDDGDGRDGDARASAVATVILCPAAILEGTVNGHNDAWLMPAMAGFALALLRRRQRAALLALAAGLLVKATALLPLGFVVLTRLFARFQRLLSARRVLAAGALATLVAMALVYVLRHQPFVARMLWELVGAPGDTLPRCTRSPECVPRALLLYLFDLRATSWAVGLAFRAASALWLLWAAYRAAESGELLRWLATALLVFLLVFQSRFQAWYVLLLLPLAPFAGARVGRAIRVYCVSAVLYYAIRLPLNCSFAPVAVGAKELCELLIVSVPPLVALARRPSPPAA